MNITLQPTPLTKKLARLVGGDFYLVGGYVRNSLLGKKCADEDLCSALTLTNLEKKLEGSEFSLKSKNKALIQEVSSFLMLAVYRVFRIVYSANPKNQNGLFTVPKQVASHYAAAAMAVSEANAAAVASGDALEGQEPLKEVESLAITSESLNQTYPMFASSLMNLIQNSESKITKEK